MMIRNSVITALFLWATASSNCFFVKAQVATRTEGTYGICYYPECIEAECCGAGTTWDSTIGMCISGSPSFDGTYPDDFTHECRKHSCYEQQCCGQGTDYIGGVCIGPTVTTFAEINFVVSYPQNQECASPPCSCRLPQDDVKILVEQLAAVYNYYAAPYCFSLAVEANSTMVLTELPPGAATVVPSTASPAPVVAPTILDSPGPSSAPSSAPSIEPTSSRRQLQFVGCNVGIAAIAKVTQSPGFTYLTRTRPSCPVCVCFPCRCIRCLKDPEEWNDEELRDCSQCLVPCDVRGDCRRELQETNANNTLSPVETCLPGVPDLNQILTSFNSAILETIGVPLEIDYNNATFVDITSLGSISGSVTEDVDNDNVGDDALIGIPVTLVDDDTGGVLSTTTTNSDGLYTFEGIPPGNYNVVEVDPPNYFSVSDVDGASNSNNVIALTIPDVFDPTGVAGNSTGNDFVDEEVTP